MPKCVNCGSSKLELWSLSGRMEDVEKDGSSLVCKDCGRMQPDTVLREMVAEAKRKASGNASPSAAQQNAEQQSAGDGQHTVQ
ncbi:MAG: hypothetical protein WA139_04990 [Candidatus Aenigmatarchaeota archaeon]